MASTLRRADTQILNPRKLRPFHRKLAKLCRGRSKVPVEVLHLGDSHTAADIFTGYLRDLFQDEFGSGGRGMLPVGKPFRYYGPKQVKVSAGTRWSHLSSFKRKHAGPFGLTGFRAIGKAPKQRLTLATRKSPPFEMVKLEVREQRNGGGLNIRIGDRPLIKVSTQLGSYAAQGQAGTLHWVDPLRAPDGERLPFVEHTFYVGSGARKIEIWPAGDGPVELMSWSLRQGEPGVLYHNQGIIGATAQIINRWDPALLRAQLARLRPDLITLAFGTNEGFNDTLNIRRYEGQVRRAVQLLIAAAPRTPIGIIAPPDAARVPRFCGKAVRKQASCTPLSSEERRNYRKLVGKKDRRLCRWHAPPNLERVREALKRVADSEGLFYWDWSGVMGGQCGADRWTREQPRLAHTDRVHLTGRGYRRSAEALYAELRGAAACPTQRPRRS
ncbi:MAG: GDSL-type esterase/lipase family protein [Pseudomonadota bacterium]